MPLCYLSSSIVPAPVVDTSDQEDPPAPVFGTAVLGIVPAPDVDTSEYDAPVSVVPVVLIDVPDTVVSSCIIYIAKCKRKKIVNRRGYQIT